MIGAGQAGGPLATALAGAGRRTALIEREHVGGTCINEGCTPTKTMVASARVAYLARRGADYGVRTGPVGSTCPGARAQARHRREFRGGSQRRIEKHRGAGLVFGEARFSGPPAPCAVDGRTLQADLVFINTGGRPAPPEVPGLDRVGPLDSTSIMELDRGPRSPDRAGRRLHRPRVRPDVPPLRQPGDRRPARAGSCCRSRTRTSPTRCRDPAGGRDRGAAGGRGPRSRRAARTMAA